eukprot:486210_1
MSNKNRLRDGTIIELLWPPSGQWQKGTITHVWGNGEYAIQFADDPFNEPLSYRLDSYSYRIISSKQKPKLQSSYTRTNPVTGELGRIRKKDDQYMASFTRRAKRKKERRETKVTKATKGSGNALSGHISNVHTSRKSVTQKRWNNVIVNDETEEFCGDKRINYLELDDYMINIDDQSLNKLTTAQLIQRLKSHNLPINGFKRELIERWKSYKQKV